MHPPALLVENEIGKRRDLSGDERVGVVLKEFE
jgi:hypothetical protein